MTLHRGQINGEKTGAQQARVPERPNWRCTRVSAGEYLLKRVEERENQFVPTGVSISQPYLRQFRQSGVPNTIPAGSLLVRVLLLCIPIRQSVLISPSPFFQDLRSALLSSVKISHVLISPPPNLVDLLRLSIHLFLSLSISPRSNSAVETKLTTSPFPIASYVLRRRLLSLVKKKPPEAPSSRMVTSHQSLHTRIHSAAHTSYSVSRRISTRTRIYA
ncbi:uncharacterized protein FOMMEDRAFT_152518 [Fomitiporia mediterranea MF3/22]|uniref:uncharacterized protein n=1 Tax=Fomitiporia mediterranea (strain MF3/22) TaxID=694068 RepID=UPI0004407BFB|nr:uncharacterized protein FOMMEDRAFT_152518 [Fomitiporia mediterranea MF3/22]EJD07156.1 hypothetical protein FOMMEDRAFT_152518 [Fomitiporia mediterranea MF3/22]